MNDRFKFRVFISDKKNSKNSLTGMFKVHSLHTGTNKAIISSLYGNVSIKLDNNILMQCTGLKDNNGKLIYEGDVVNGSCGVYWGKMIVEYNVAGFVLNKNGKYLNFLEGENYIEVIGNIYENKDLLNE